MEGNNKTGPLAILPVLEEATSTWTNVLNQTYELGTTVFKDNAYTRCDYDDTNKNFSCTMNKYTLSERTAKTRMMTVQEAHALGCTTDEQSCPLWMYNYLYESIKNGGTVNGLDHGYWSSSTTLTNTSVWYVKFNGHIGYYNTSTTDMGARAVIVISK